MSAAPHAAPVRGATYAIIVLTAMNLLNYVDRWVPSAVKDLFKEDLSLTDAETSLPLSAFVIVYMFASPLFASLAEHVSRTRLIAAGVALWSLATAAAALAEGFWSLLAARALVGVGEAAYATIAPALLSDYFPPERRNRIFTIFYVAIPVGSALGFVLGGKLGESFGWRAAFLFCGLPGLLVALLALFIRVPDRGPHDAEAVPAPPWAEALKRLAKNRTYLVTVAGYTAVTFATGGITDWFATYLHRTRDMSIADADRAIGLAAVVGGLLGTVVGGLAADRLRGIVRQPYLFLSAASMLPATVLIALALYVVTTPAAITVCVVAAMIFFMAYNGPINALIVNSVDVGLRVRAFGLSILSIHLFGDVLSPPLIGVLSDRTDDLGASLLIVPVTMLLGACIWAYGWRMLPDDAASPATNRGPSDTSTA